MPGWRDLERVLNMPRLRVHQPNEEKDMTDEDFDAAIASFMEIPAHRVRELLLSLATYSHVRTLITPTAVPHVVATLKQAAKMFGVRCDDDIRRSLEAEQRMLECWHYLFRAGVLVPGWDLERLCDSFYHVVTTNTAQVAMISTEERILLRDFWETLDSLAAQKEKEGAA